MTIRNIRQSKLDSKELTVLSIRLVELVEEKNIDDVNLTKLLGYISVDVSDMEKALGRSTASEYTAVLRDKDDIRDRAFVLFRDMIKAYLNIPDPDIRDAAELLYKIIEKHGISLHRLSYVKQTAQTRLLSKDLDSDEALNAIELTNTKQFYDDFLARQKDFENAYNTKVKDESGKDIPLLRESRIQLNNHLESLTYYINLIAEINPGVYDGMVEEMNTIIDDIESGGRGVK